MGHFGVQEALAEVRDNGNVTAGLRNQTGDVAELTAVLGFDKSDGCLAKGALGASENS